MLKWNQIKIINNNNNFLTEQRNCPICDGSSNNSFISFESFQFYTDDITNSKQVEIKEVQCLKCGALFLNPCYSNNGFEVLFKEASASYSHKKDLCKERIDWLKKNSLLGTNKRIMDIGCSQGDFLKALPRHLNKTGVDIDRIAIDIARKENSNIEFIYSDFTSISYSNQIDLITMFHTLEHLPEPKSFLKALYKIASQDTKLIIEVPILEKGKTNDINGFFSVMHLTHFTKESLHEILALSGWKIINTKEFNSINSYRLLLEKSKLGVNKDCIDNNKLKLYSYLKHWYNELYKVES
jgi:ubiquinone/menaquinone biosynthesis C-methylase UbiE